MKKYHVSVMQGNQVETVMVSAAAFILAAKEVARRAKLYGRMARVGENRHGRAYRVGTALVSVAVAHWFD